MYCEECKRNLATVHLTQISDSKKTESHLCEECAAQKGTFIPEWGQNFNTLNFLGSVISDNMRELNQTYQHLACPNCGSTFPEIIQKGRLGCGECYKAFEQELEPTLRRIHGNNLHIGKLPARGGEKVLLKQKIEELKADLQQAVIGEEYEKAAQIRDAIKEIENSI